MESERELLEESIIYTFGNGEIEKALQLAKDNGMPDLVSRFESAVAFKKSVDSFRTHYEADNGRAAGSLNKTPDRRQRGAMEQIRALHADNLLDVGCADGSFCFFCLRENVVNRATGIDPYVKGIDWAIKYSDHFPGRANFSQGLLEDVVLKPEFDVIYMGEVLEHVLDPVASIRRALSFSKDLKGIVVTVPVGRPPLLEHEKKKVNAVAEHIRFIDEVVLEGYCKETGLVMAKAERVGSRWVNLIATLSHAQGSSFAGSPTI